MDPRRFRGAPALLIVLALASAPLCTAAEEPLPHIDTAVLDHDAPGWTMVEAQGDATQGLATAERMIWPIFYLHWRPLGEGEKTLNVEEARAAVAGLWQGLTIDEPLTGKEIALRSHHATLFETTLSHGEVRARYIVWSCPQSKRVLVADMTESLKVAAPPELSRWLEAIARSVKCHEGADAEASALVPVAVEIPNARISLSHPQHWLPVIEYRVQPDFGGIDFTAAKPLPTAESGQSIVVPSDAVMRVRYSWGPAPDAPMSYNILKEQVETYLATRAGNLAISSMKAEGGLWIADGFMRMTQNATTVPPSRMRNFRAWMWLTSSRMYFALVETGGVHLGRRKIVENPKQVDTIYASIYKALVP